MQRIVSVVSGVVMVGLALSASAQTDAIPRAQLTAVGPGADSSDFPIATAISRVTFTLNGMEVDFDKKDLWPSGRTPGWDGDLQYSIGFVLKVNDWWYASAPIENWRGRAGSTGPVQDQTVTSASNPRCMGQFQCNVFYDQRWDPLQTRRPSPGETIGVYVVSGDARNDTFVTGVRERSNIVLVQLPGQGQTAAFEFTGAPVPPPPIVVPPPPPVIVPPPVQPPPVIQPPAPPSAVDYTEQIRQIIAGQQALLALEQSTNAEVAQLNKSFTETLGKVMAFVGKYIAPPIVAFIAARQMK